MNYEQGTEIRNLQNSDVGLFFFLDRSCRLDFLDQTGCFQYYT